MSPPGEIIPPRSPGSIPEHPPLCSGNGEEIPNPRGWWVLGQGGYPKSFPLSKTPPALFAADCSRSLTPRMSEWDPASIAPKSQLYGILLPLCCQLGCAGPPQKPGTPPKFPAPGPGLRGSTCWLLWEGASPAGNLGQFLPVNPWWDAGVGSCWGSGVPGGRVVWSEPDVGRESGGSPEHLPRLVPCWLHFILGINALSGLVSPESGIFQRGSCTSPSQSCCPSGTRLILPDLEIPALS